MLPRCRTSAPSTRQASPRSRPGLAWRSKELVDPNFPANPQAMPSLAENQPVPRLPGIRIRCSPLLRHGPNIALASMDPVLVINAGNRRTRKTKTLQTIWNHWNSTSLFAQFYLRTPRMIVCTAECLYTSEPFKPKIWNLLGGGHFEMVWSANWLEPFDPFKCSNFIGHNYQQIKG